MRNPTVNTSLQASISLERLTKYLQAADEDLDSALALYERNTRLSEAFYTPLQGIEISLRNTLNQQMIRVYGDEWLQNRRPPLHSNTQEQIDEIYRNMRSKQAIVSQGSVVAELKFSFWVGLLSKAYDATLWRHALYRSFPRGGGKPRAPVHKRMDNIRRFRNRIAHNESIFDQNVSQQHIDILEGIGWMCSKTRDWVAHNSRLPIELG